MCGISGLFTNRFRADELTAVAQAMATAQAHRGPDDSGVWADPEAGIALGFRRLAIVDLSEAGHQPMLSASGRFVLVFNGEVYNHNQLRSELRAVGFNFRGHSDSEVILASFEHWGIRAALPRFIGMFGIAVWDRVERRLTLIRDRLGIKPLYIHRSQGTISFGSELKALQAAPSFDRGVDRDALAAYMRYLYVPAPRSIFRSVTKLLPGHLLEITDPNAELRAPEPYWSVRAKAIAGRSDPFQGDSVEAVDALDGLLRDAVGLRMVADVPVGALLSGGIDSSTVVALMQAQSSRPVRTYTIGFDDREYDEARHAAAVAGVLGTEHTELRLGGADALGLVPEMPRLFDEPIADPSILPTYLVCQLARRDVTVALSGDGGDELFAGYNRYVEGRWLIPAVDSVPVPLRRAFAAGARAVGGDAADLRSFRGRIGKLGRLMRGGSAGSMYRSLHSAWLDPLEPVPGASDPLGIYGETLAGYPQLDLLGRMQLADQQVYLPDDLLLKVDQASMAVALEARVPLLDHRVVEFSWRLPASLKIQGDTSKWLLRQVLYRYVPRALVERPKMGFSVPLDSWLRGPLRAWGSDLVASAANGRIDHLDGEALRRAWSEFQGGRGYSALAMWAAVTFVAWYERWSRPSSPHEMAAALAS